MPAFKNQGTSLKLQIFAISGKLWSSGNIGSTFLPDVEWLGREMGIAVITGASFRGVTYALLQSHLSYFSETVCFTLLHELPGVCDSCCRDYKIKSLARYLLSGFVLFTQAKHGYLLFFSEWLFHFPIFIFSYIVLYLECS